MRLIAFLAACLALAANAHADAKRITKAESRLLLAMPYLEQGRDLFEDLGWNAQETVRTTYAALLPDRGFFPQAQAYLSQAAPLTYWKSDSTLDAAWIRQRFPFFRDKEVQVTVPASATDDFLRTARFVVGPDQCVAFEMMQLGDPGMPMDGDSRFAISGVYCAPSGTTLDDGLVKRVVEGVFIRRSGGIERVMKGVQEPLPAKLID